jgi:hypothetical protein
MRRLLPVLVAGLTMIGCDEGRGRIVMGGPSPAPLGASLALSPQLLSARPIGGPACPTFLPFGIDFDLVIGPEQAEVFVDGVTIRLGDGTNIGSPALSFPRGELERRFGSTQVHAGATRSLPFRPQFGCGIPLPRTLFVDVDLLDLIGGRLTRTVRADLR